MMSMAPEWSVHVAANITARLRPWWAFWKKPVRVKLECLVEAESEVEAEQQVHNYLFWDHLLYRAYCSICVESMASRMVNREKESINPDRLLPRTIEDPKCED